MNDSFNKQNKLQKKRTKIAKNGADQVNLGEFWKQIIEKIDYSCFFAHEIYIFWAVSLAQFNRPPIFFFWEDF
jgi:hypothetical protein